MSGKISKIFCCVRRPRRPSKSRPPCYGLVTASSRQPVPLQGIWVEVGVKGFVADVSATLKYKNEKMAVDAVFVFPVNEDSAIYSFEATIGKKKKIIADLQEKGQVDKTYDGSISPGQQAFLREEEESMTNIFICSLGALPPGQEANVTLRYVQELAVEEDGAVRFVLPDVLNPSILKDYAGSITDTRPEIPQTLSLSAHFKSAYGITKIESNCDITPLEYTGSDRTGAKVSLMEGHTFDREVQLLAYYTNMDKPSVMVEAGLGSADTAQVLKAPPTGSLMVESVAMLNLYSSFPEIMEESSPKEFIFLVDQSASMSCTITTGPNPLRRIQAAKETLVFLLKSLPLGSYFNVFGFGTSYRSFFLESVAYTQQSMEEALKKVDEIRADLGGTEIGEPLKKIYDTAGTEGRPRLIFVFTDGEVDKEAEKKVIVEVKKNAQKHRCFTFGIGCGASTSLVKGMAEAGNGTFEFISDKHRMQPKVEDEAEGEVCLQYELQDEIVKNNIRFPLNVQKTEKPTIHRLAAKALISELEHGLESDSEEVKKKILETSLQSGVISTLTAYVAINKETKTHVEGPPRYRGDLTQDYGILRDLVIGGPEAANEMFSDYPHDHLIHCGHSLHPVSHSHHMTERHYHTYHHHGLDDPEAVWLISLQNADGSWNLTPRFSDTLGISKKEIKARNPNKNMEVSVWVTVLAVIWLHTSCPDQRSEWELLVKKAVSWVRAKAGSSLGEMFRAGNRLLRSSVDPEVFGL